MLNLGFYTKKINPEQNTLEPAGFRIARDFQASMFGQLMLNSAGQ